CSRFAITTASGHRSPRAARPARSRSRRPTWARRTSSGTTCHCGTSRTFTSTSRSRTPRVRGSASKASRSKPWTLTATAVNVHVSAEALRRFAVALLVLLAATARARLVAADLRRGDHRALAFAGTAARHRGIERFDHDLGWLDDRRGGLDGHRVLFDVLGEQLGELGVDVRLRGDEGRRDAFVRRLVGEPFDLRQLLGDDLVGVGEVLLREARQRTVAIAIEHRP